jgi:NAD(P)-dependent dehydrogenase (short-subunit alcohol dehydrogenase family)
MGRLFRRGGCVYRRGMAETQGVVVITGASSGFGRLAALFLARNGYRVFATMRELAGRNAGAADEIRGLARAESLDLHVAEMDVTEDGSVEDCIRQVVERAGGVDVLVNNAGFGHMGLLESFSPEQAGRIFDTNVLGALRTIRAVLPHMHRRRQGLLIQISSGAGRLVLPAMGLYCASKFALEAVSEAYRYELASVGIDSVVVQPGAYPTEIFGKIETGVDAAREDAYGDARQIAGKVRGALTASTADPMDIPKALLRIIETPAGARALRYRVAQGASRVDDINTLCAQVQEQFLSALGVVELTRFREPPPASSADRQR